MGIGRVDKCNCIATINNIEDTEKRGSYKKIQQT